MNAKNCSGAFLRGALGPGLALFMILCSCLSTDPSLQPSKEKGAGTSAQASDASLSLVDFLPDPAILDAWTPAGEPDRYKGEDLFIYINGGAEIYHEYGFKQVLVQRFTGPSDHSITLEIFQMADADAAYGIYSFKRGGHGETVPFGDEGFFESYYINFWKADLVVTLIGRDEDRVTREGLEAIAECVDARITRTGSLPRLVELLPREGRIEARTKYLAGPLGFFNCCASFPRNVIEFEAAAVGVYANGVEIHLFRCPDARRSAQNFSRVREAFRKGTGYTSFEDEGAAFSVRDKEDRLLRIQSQHEYIVILSTKGWNAVSESLLEKIRDNLVKAP
ncbi:MAG: DUF6599 family protein [Planctomycetota bacterium]